MYDKHLKGASELWSDEDGDIAEESKGRRDRTKCHLTHGLCFLCQSSGNSKECLWESEDLLGMEFHAVLWSYLRPITWWFVKSRIWMRGSLFSLKRLLSHLIYVCCAHTHTYPWQMWAKSNCRKLVEKRMMAIRGKCWRGKVSLPHLLICNVLFILSVNFYVCNVLLSLCVQHRIQEPPSLRRHQWWNGEDHNGMKTKKMYKVVLFEGGL